MGPGGLRAPAEVAFAMHSWPLLLPTFTLFLSLSLHLRLLLLTHFVQTSEGENLFPPYFGITRRNILSRKKKTKVFWACLKLFMASVRSRPPGPPSVPGVLTFVPKNAEYQSMKCLKQDKHAKCQYSPTRPTHTVTILRADKQ